MRMKFLLILDIVFALAVSGCVTGTAVQTGDHTYAPRADWAGVKLYFEKPTRPYEVVGPVSALGAPAAQERAIYDMLKQQAASLGADAVLVGGSMSTAYRDGFFHGKKNSGIAIKFTDRGT